MRITDKCTDKGPVSRAETAECGRKEPNTEAFVLCMADRSRKKSRKKSRTKTTLGAEFTRAKS